MIFYFTGTGNSKYIADRLAVCFDEIVVDIGQAVINSEFTYDCTDEKYIGFVFPTYAWSIPNVVREFVTNMELDNVPEDAYVFAINNCGASEGKSLYDLSAILSEKNIKLSYSRSIVLPDNYLIMTNVPDEDQQKKIFRTANIKLANIINNIGRKKKSVILHKGGIKFLFYLIANKFFTKFMNRTSKFTVNDNCVSCGLCEKICNSAAINIKDGKPVWVKSTCVQCLGCISRCPVEAIEYGSKTEGKTKYVNPFVKFDYTVVIESDINKENNNEKETDEPSEEMLDTEVSITENDVVSEYISEVKEGLKSKKTESEEPKNDETE